MCPVLMVEEQPVPHTAVELSSCMPDLWLCCAWCPWGRQVRKASVLGRGLRQIAGDLRAASWTQAQGSPFSNTRDCT